MRRSSCFLIILLVVALGNGGCSKSKQNSTIIEQSSKGTLKVVDEQASISTQTNHPTENQEFSEKTKKDSTSKDISYKEYYNERFEFSIEYPSKFVTKMLPANGDGIILESSDGSAELTVSGINNVLDWTAKSCFDDFIKDHKNLSYKLQKDNWFVSSWNEGDNILYMKEIVGNGSINTFYFKYPLAEKEYYDQVVQKLVESFRTPGISEYHEINSYESQYDYGKVLDLFISRFLIASPDKDNITYALKSSPSEFLYTIHVDRFNEERDLYEIRLSRNTDTAQNYFYYDPKTEKFYDDGTDKEEITSDDNIYFWSPF